MHRNSQGEKTLNQNNSAGKVKEELQIAYGKMRIPVTVLYRERKRLSITVYPDKTVIARAPLDRTGEEVLHYLQKRAAWIVRQLEYFDQFQPSSTGVLRSISADTAGKTVRQRRNPLLPGPAVPAQDSPWKEIASETGGPFLSYGNP
jgi:hypothetical protein